MRPKLFIATLILLIFLASHIAKGRLVGQGPLHSQATIDEKDRSLGPRRIVSMAPSVTEMLFALGVGERLVGVSRYCNYPKETANIPRVGGVIDPNIEAIVALKPDLAVLLHGNNSICPALNRLGIKTLTVDHKTIEGVLESIPTLGRACGAEPAADAMAADLQMRIDRIRRKTAGLERPEVLLSVMRNFGAGRLEDIYVTGNDDYFDEMIEIAGGHNLFGNVSARYPVVSAESIIKTDPQIIIDILPGMNAGEAKAAAEDWRKLGAVDAVVHGKVFCLHADFVSVPGPRFILLLEKMAVLLHPEVDWGEEEKKDDRGQRTDDRGKGTSSRLRLRKLNHYVRTKTINVGTTFGTG